MILRPVSPNAPAAALANAAVLNAIRRFPPRTKPAGKGLPTRLARMLGVPTFAGLPGEKIDQGLPDCHCVIPEIFQPPTIYPAGPRWLKKCLPGPKGNS